MRNSVFVGVGGSCHPCGYTDQLFCLIYRMVCFTLLDVHMSKLYLQIHASMFIVSHYTNVNFLHR